MRKIAPRPAAREARRGPISRFNPANFVESGTLLVLALLCCLLGSGAARAAVPVEIAVEGVSAAMRGNILASLSLARERGHPLLGELRIQRLHRRAPEEIRRALRPFGYYDAEVEAALTEQAGTWYASYVVRPGEPVRIRQIELELLGPGAEDPELRQWRRSFPLRSGDVLIHSVYEGAKNELLLIARERGYMEAELLTHEVRVHVGERRAEVALTLETGPRYRFGAIHFAEVPLRESFLQRFADFTPGDYYDANKVFRFNRALIDSDYFSQVDVIPRVEATGEEQVPVDVGLEMRSRNRYTMGLGYGTDTGPRISAGVERRWANSLGHRWSAEALVSEINSSLVLNYRVPLKRPTTDFLGVVGSREHEETDTSIRDTSAVGVNINHLMGGNWLRTWALNYQEESFEVAAQVDRSNLLYPSLAFQKVEAENRIFPVRGWRLLAEARAAWEEVGSSTSLVQGRLNAKDVRPLFGGRLLTRFDVGASVVGDINELPVSLRFFAGGDQSVRGYTYQSLGPTNDDDDVIGGQHLLVGSVEYDRYFGDIFGAALFADAGNAFTSFGDYILHKSAGFGLRWRLPFGNIRLDFANAYSRADRPWNVHLTIGPDL